MKKLLILLSLTLFFTSCSNDYIDDGKKVEFNANQVTNLDLISKIDTNKMYYVVIDKDNKLYCINSSKIVEYQVQDFSGSFTTVLLALAIIMLSLLFIGSIIFD